MKRWMIIAAAAGWLTAGAASADVMGDLARSGTCWTRTYDAAHLRTHPRQVVSKFSLVTVPGAAGDRAGSRSVYFGFRLRQTGELNGGAAGCVRDGAAARCTAGMDAGAFRLEGRPGGGLRLSVANSLMGERPDGQYTSNLAASDDRTFDLDRAAAGACSDMAPH